MLLCVALEILFLILSINYRHKLKFLSNKNSYCHFYIINSLLSWIKVLHRRLLNFVWTISKNAKCISFSADQRGCRWVHQDFASIFPPPMIFFLTSLSSRTRLRRAIPERRSSRTKRHRFCRHRRRRWRRSSFLVDVLMMMTTTTTMTMTTTTVTIDFLSFYRRRWRRCRLWRSEAACKRPPSQFPQMSGLEKPACAPDTSARRTVVDIIKQIHKFRAG